MKPRDPVARWLAAERAASEAEAEAALAALLADLDQPAPPAGFAARVMRRAAEDGVLPVAAAAPARWRSWSPRVSWPQVMRSTWARAAAVLLLLTSGLTVALALGALQPLLAGFSSGDLVAGLADLATAVGAAVTGLAEAVEYFAALRRAIALALGSPVVALALGLCLALAAGGFRLLHDILQRERSWSYVDPI
ncbi:MAG TPA: hypothetical protein VEG34_03275 [Thermoanaerobaculia bacterium]|nr:hypothetical protein [Thermoanaerobaculia bacterium]